MTNLNEQILHNISQDIQDVLYGYVKAASFTSTKDEKKAEEFFVEYFSRQGYFQQHPELYGAVPIAGDPLERAACFAMVKGQGPDTVVMIHHYDVVTVEDFKRLAPLAFSPDELEKELLTLADTLFTEARDDLLSGRYLFGRGVCDMKGGGSIQMALVNRFGHLLSQEPEALPGNVIVLGVPDEENLSAGMRSAVLLLDELKQRYGLNYRLMINSEPHQRKHPEKGVFSTGSVGKMLPFFYIRGSLTHAGKVFEGFNPMYLLSAIAGKTEMNMALSDVIGREAAPPPTWLYLRDTKLVYDVSMPLSAYGCLSVLTLNQTPDTLLSQIRSLCTEAFEEVLASMNQNYSRFLNATGQKPESLPWRVKVVDFSELRQEAESIHGDAFHCAYKEKTAELAKKHASGSSLLDCNFQLVDFIFQYIDDLSPRVVFGLLPPYYPNVTNAHMKNLPPDVNQLPSALNLFTQEAFGQTYVEEAFYTGISDLSYSSFSDSQAVTQVLQETMPLFGTFYQLPLQSIEAISMPCINIGPWGKDFHKLTERVLKEDLYERTPQIILKAIEIMFQCNDTQ